jgi:hypothetical protein
MEITGAVIIVRMDDGKIRQVDISSNDVLRLLYTYQQQADENINIIDRPIDGLELYNIARKMADFGNVKPMPKGYSFEKGV